MKSELEMQLKARHPAILKLLRNHRTHQPIGRGLECWDGWFHLIDGLCAELQAIVDAGDAQQLVAVQIKEKFAGLRFHARMGRAYKTFAPVIERAARRSLEICAICGEPGKLQEGGYLIVLCDRHVADKSWRNVE